MKNLIMISLFIFCGSVFAQPTQETETPQREMLRKKLQNISPTERATLQAKRMTLQLDLSEKQQNQVTTLLLNSIENRKEKMPTKKRSELTTEERVALKNKRLDQQIAFNRALGTILNKEQMEKWQATIEQKRDKQQKRIKKRNKNKM